MEVHMRIAFVSIRNFRRLEDVEFSFETDNTVFVGPNNSGKTSAAAAFRLFFKRSEFAVHDFTVSCVENLNKFGAEAETRPGLLPAIEMDLWLDIDPKIEFGRVFSLLPNVTTDFEKVGIRLRYCVKDADKLKAEFNAAFPQGGEKKSKTLEHFFSLSSVLSRHFGIRYYALEAGDGQIKATEIEPDEGKRLLHSLIRVDFVDAQRNIHDQDSGRHNRLSAAFAAYYKHNLEKPAENEQANKVIDENNNKLTEHYATHFARLLDKIATLGVPSAHDRNLRLVSSLNAQEALQGSTELYYVDSASKHELPEAYNGLGFKNLVYMAIQISHFHSQWLTTENNRELCQVVFVEEPEVHLHAQVQQVFITNIWTILKDTARQAGEPTLVPQLVISTHSSHIVDTIEFEKVRYFCRCPMKSAVDSANSLLTVTKICNLQDFKPSPISTPVLTEEEKAKLTKEEASAHATSLELERQETLNFLKKYMKLTHCDLFFADAVILVEGTVEKLLLPTMIRDCEPALLIRYLTVLEIGGAYAHKLAGLLAFLGIPYLVITDIDTVDPADERKSCSAKTENARSSNAALKYYLKKNTRIDLLGLKIEECVVADNTCFVTFQREVEVTVNGTKANMHGRTLEETFVYENLALFQNGKLSIGCDIATPKNAEAIQKIVYEHIKSDSFKKTDFALSVISSAVPWATPAYIATGLEWLAKRLGSPAPAFPKPAKAIEVA